MIQFGAMDGKQSLMEERRPVTILFTDIVGSTTLAEKLDPEEWKEIVNGAHQRVSASVTRYEGTIAQLLGDGVLAFFGAPHAHEDDPARAVRAGLDMQRAMTEYALELRGLVDNFQMRVGINTGNVVVGAIGSADHSEYLAVGDAVNLAARMQSAAQPSTVLISETTARLVRGVFEVRDLGEIILKGKAKSQRVFEVVDQSAGFTKSRGIPGLTSPLVGREGEFWRLQNALTELQQGRGQIVAVIGEPGIGKSRLVEELRGATAESYQPLAGTPSASARFLEGRALSYGQTLSFWMIVQLIQDDLGLTDGESGIQVRVALRRRLKQLIGDKAEDVYPYLAHLLGVKLEGDAAERIRMLDGETLKRQVLISVSDYFAKLAAEQPTVVVIEDLHWADPSSLDAVERLLRVTLRVPLMIVMLTRRETEQAPWRIIELAGREYRDRFTEIELEPLSSSDSQALVSNLLAMDHLPERVRSLIWERAEGNPLFVEEIVRELIERGVIVQEGSSWKAQTEIGELEIPETLHGVLLARIDRLQSDVKSTLQLASVIGRTFLYKLLEAISEAERELDWHLSQLERTDLVREKTRLPDLEYIFKHSLTREAAYESLLHERRTEFHRRVGDALEQLSMERQDEFLGLLAYHYDRAGATEKAIDYLLRAGDKARLSEAHQEAVRFYQRAIELLNENGEDERVAKTWLKLGLIYHANFEFEKAHQANEMAFTRQQKLRNKLGRVARVRPAGDVAARILRSSLPAVRLTLDPGLSTFEGEHEVVVAVFAGLAELDVELNVLPHAARSWEVLEGGRRYVFHMRDDVYWTDGTRVTAQDFEWAWKRNMTPATHSVNAIVFDEIEGAKDFREGRSRDPNRVGVQALDALTLQVRLVKPVAYFPYLLTLSITYPLPRAVIELYGDEWWKPEHVVSNGAFRLLEFDKERFVLERNPTYFGEFPGNLDRIERWATFDSAERLREYLEEMVGLCALPRTDTPPNLDEMVSAKERHYSPGLGLAYLTLAPYRPPLDDLRVRRALIHSLDRQQVSQVHQGTELPVAHGGVIPPGIPGHSPELSLRFDPDLARRLLAEAGYAEGLGFPPLVIHYFGPREPKTEIEIARQWRQQLGIDVSIQRTSDKESPAFVPQIWRNAWSADYPDPDNFSRTTLIYSELRKAGWQNQRYVDLVETAASTTNRTERMALYREADRIWVAEDVVVCPLAYFYESQQILLIKPWVKNWDQNRMGAVAYKNVRIEPH